MTTEAPVLATQEKDEDGKDDNGCTTPRAMLVASRQAGMFQEANAARTFSTAVCAHA